MRSLGGSRFVETLGAAGKTIRSKKNDKVFCKNDKVTANSQFPVRFAQVSPGNSSKKKNDIVLLKMISGPRSI